MLAIFLALFVAGQQAIVCSRAVAQELPIPETVTLTTQDQWVLTATYYPGTKEKQTIPLILVHDWEGNREEMFELAAFLQREYGHASIIPDLRGHGDSRPPDADEVLPLDRWRPEQIQTIIEDIEASKRFLVAKHNEGVLNVDMLVVVAEGRTCVYAAQWAIIDWSYGELGLIKQGRDVKGLVFIAPSLRFQNQNLAQTVQHGLFNGEGLPALPLLIASNAGNTRSTSDANSVYNRLRRMRSGPGKEEAEASLYRIEYRWVDDQRLAVEGGTLEQMIGAFLREQLEPLADRHRWLQRAVTQ